MGKQGAAAVPACLFCFVDTFGVPVGVMTWAERWGAPWLSPAWPPREHSPWLLSGAGEARVPCPAVSGGGAHTDGLHHVRRLEVRAGNGL